MNQLVNPFQQADALDEVLLDVAALIELSPRDRRIAEKKLWLVERRRSYRQILWMPPESGGLLFFAVGELYAGDDVLNQCVAAQSSPAFLGCLAQLEHHRQTRAA